jgi:hypothetical protein
MTRMIELTDLMDGNNEVYAVVPVDHVAATIRQWYPADDQVRPSDLEKVDELQAALIAEDCGLARDLAAEIAVGFDEATPSGIRGQVSQQDERGCGPFHGTPYHLCGRVFVEDGETLECTDDYGHTGPCSQ